MRGLARVRVTPLCAVTFDNRSLVKRVALAFHDVDRRNVAQLLFNAAGLGFGTGDSLGRRNSVV